MATVIPRNDAGFVLGEIAASCGGRIDPSSAGKRVRGVVTDSRAVQPGNLYVALRGENHDGHAFLAQARSAGAGAVLVESMHEVPSDLPVVCVPDTRKALGALALLHRNRWGGKVVAITGSAGKSTTKELSAAALSALGHRVLKTQGNLNNEIGVPMTLLCLDSTHDMAVIELGTSGPGEIAHLAQLARADVGVVTTVSLAHTAGLGSLAAVADEKCALLRMLGKDGVAIYSADSEPLRARVSSFAGRRKLGFGLHDQAEVKLVKHAIDRELLTQCEFSVAPSGELVLAELGLSGIGPALDAAAALAVVLALHDRTILQSAAQSLRSVTPLAGRLVPRRSANGALVIDDTYNANPASMHASLATLLELARVRSGRAIAALGDMAELGEHAQAEHERVGREAVQLGVSTLFLCGTQMLHAARSARTAAAERHGSSATRIEHFTDLGACARELLSTLQAQDAVLVKGSRSMTMERLVESLVGNGAHTEVEA